MVIKPKYCYFNVYRLSTEHILEISHLYLTVAMSHFILPDSCVALGDRCGYQATALVAVSVWGWSGGLQFTMMLSCSPIGHNFLTRKSIGRVYVTRELSVSLNVMYFGGGVYAAEHIGLYPSFILLHKHQYAYAQVQLSCVYLCFQENPPGMNRTIDSSDCRCLSAEPRQDKSAWPFSILWSLCVCGISIFAWSYPSYTPWRFAVELDADGWKMDGVPLIDYTCMPFHRYLFSCGTEWMYQHLNTTASTAMWQKVCERCFMYAFHWIFLLRVFTSNIILF